MSVNPPKFDLSNKSSYRSLLGEASWNNLHPAIKSRFSETEYKKSVTYTGTMTEVFLSPAGKLLAHLCRLIGTPLALYSGVNIPTRVCVYPNTKLGGMTWDRHYHYPKKTVNRVRSTKCINNATDLVELVGFGFGMELRVFEKTGALYFESTQFFCQIGKIRVKIPNLLSPGKTLVRQKALDDERFEFTLHVEHPLLGNVFRQRGIFTKE